MHRCAVRCLPIVLVALISIAVASPAKASIELGYFELAQGSSATEVIVRWGTETEPFTAAFSIKRGVSADPTQAIVVHTTPATGSSVLGDDYEYTDSGLTPGQVYYYWLIAIATDGTQLELGIEQITAGGTSKTYLPVIPISAPGKAASSAHRLTAGR
jgi:hypothetical protein